MNNDLSIANFAACVGFNDDRSSYTQQSASRRIDRSAHNRVRLITEADADYRVGVYVARKAPLNSIFRDISFFEEKAWKIIETAVYEPGRLGLIYANRLADVSLPENGLLGFSSKCVGARFVDSVALIATVFMPNVSQNLNKTLLGGKVAKRLVQAVLYWVKARHFPYLLTQLTNGPNEKKADPSLDGTEWRPSEKNTLFLLGN